MTADFTEFLDMTAEELYEDWLNYITTAICCCRILPLPRSTAF